MELVSVKKHLHRNRKAKIDGTKRLKQKKNNLTRRTRQLH